MSSARMLSVVLLGLLALAGFLVGVAVADIGEDLGVTTLTYWDGSGGQVCYGGLAGGIIWRPDHVYGAYNPVLKAWEAWNEPERVFIWLNYALVAPGDDIPDMTLAGVGYDIYEFAGFTLAPEVGGVLRGSTDHMQLGFMGSVRAYRADAPVLMRIGFGYVPENEHEGAGRFILFKVGVSL